MIPTFIIWLISRYRKNKNIKRGKAKIFGKLRNQLSLFASIILLAILLLSSAKCHSQTRSLNYEILRNGNKIGFLHFTQSIMKGFNHLQVESEMEARFLFSFIVKVKEEAFYFNGILFRSSIYRQMNGNKKINKQHQAFHNEYIIQTGKRSEVTKNYPITYNMLNFYIKEPVDISKVYSDNFETFIAIEKVDAHKYKIKLPDGNYNCYYYKDGVLYMFEVHSSLYSATIVLTNKH